MTSFEYLIGTSNDIFKTELKLHPPEEEGFCASHLSEGPPPARATPEVPSLSLTLMFSHQVLWVLLPKNVPVPCNSNVAPFVHPKSCLT